MSHPDFNPTCPEGGTWYACGNGARFVGCCLDDPCNSDGCGNGRVKPASFSGQYYPTTDAYLDQNCTTKTNASFYICADTTPTFFGCCNSNPCLQNGCLGSDLAQIVLSSNLTRAASMDPHPAISSGNEQLSTGGIAGIVAGGVVFLVLGLTMLWWLISRRRLKKRRDNTFIAGGPSIIITHQEKQDTFSTDQSCLPAPVYGTVQPHIHEADHGTVTTSPAQSWLKSPSVDDVNRYSTAISELSIPQTLPSSLYTAYRRPSDTDNTRSFSYSQSPPYTQTAQQHLAELDGAGRSA